MSLHSARSAAALGARVARAEREAERGRDADRRRAADRHVADRRGHVVVVETAQQELLGRQAPLVDHHHDAVLPRHRRDHGPQHTSRPAAMDCGAPGHGIQSPLRHAVRRRGARDRRARGEAAAGRGSAARRGARARARARRRRGPRPAAVRPLGDGRLRAASRGRRARHRAPSTWWGRCERESWPSFGLAAGQAAKIMTGAPLPHGATAVQQVEKTRPLDEFRVTIEALGRRGAERVAARIRGAGGRRGARARPARGPRRDRGARRRPATRACASRGGRSWPCSSPATRSWRSPRRRARRRSATATARRSRRRRGSRARACDCWA